MRSFLILIVSICVIAFGFGVYWMMLGSEGLTQSPEDGGRTMRGGPTTLPTTGPTFVGPGDRPYWEHYNENAERTWRMRAERYEPQKDGRVRVFKPEADFFLRNGQVMRIIGHSGMVIMEEAVGRSGGNPAGAAAPTPRGGDLEHVTLLLLPAFDAKTPTMTMTVDNVSFDNETFRIFTREMREGTKVIPGDRVPVVVRGEDYEFDGWGLSLQYNELDRRLEYLRVAYGRRLLIKHPNKFMDQGGTGYQPVMPQHGLPAHALWEYADVMLAAADGEAVGQAIRGSGRRRRPAPATQPGEEPQRPEPVYRATFKQDVVILEGGQKLATAEELHVDFLNEDGDALSWAGGPTTQKAQATTRPVRRERMALQPATRPARQQSTTSPTTSPAERPIEIRWTGPLEVQPLPGERPPQIAPGESIVKLIGAPNKPVEITRASEGVTSNLTCAAMTHWTIDNGVLLEEGHGIRVQVHDSRGTHMVTRSMRYSDEEGTATLGPGQASLPLEDAQDPARKDVKPELMDVAWSDRCTLHLEGAGMESMVLNRAALSGKVSVTHPQVKLNADSLRLLFATDATTRPAPQPTTRPHRSSPPLRQIEADGAVQCTTVGPAGPTDIRKLDCENLRMLTARTPDGKLFARNIVAMGNVNAVDPQRHLTAGYVSVSLAQPTTRPATQPAAQPAGATAKKPEFNVGELESLIAHDNVRVVTTDAKSAEADQLVIEVKDNQPQVTLHGRPALVRDGKNTLTGPIIQMAPDLQQLAVVGKGKLEATQENKDGQPARPIEVSWDRSMRAEGKEDVIECLGNVETRTIDPDGSVSTAKGQRVRLATTRPVGSAGFSPSSQPIRAEARTTNAQPATRPVGELDIMADRAIRSIVIEEGAQVHSELKGADGKPLRLFHVESSLIRYDRDAKQLAIPQVGNMTFLDVRPPSTQPAAQEAAKDPMSMRGATRFDWQKSLIYDESAHRIVMSGGVEMKRIEYGQLTPERLEFTAQTITADLEPPTTQPAAQPAPNPQAGVFDLSPKMQLKRVVAEGGITLTSRQVNFEADSLEYDPVKHLLTVRGTDRNRARQLDEHGLEIASFLWLIWDTQKGEVVDSQQLRVINRGGGGVPLR